MNKNKKISIMLCSIGLLFLITGGTFAFFNYTKTGQNNTLVTGDIYMHLDEGQDQITLTNIFPETPEEARNRNDNEITFTISGVNESSKDIYYEIDLIHGDDLTGYTRFNDSDLVFDLIEVGENNTETYIVEAKSFDSLTNKRIWVDTIDGGTTTEIEKTYKLRMWLSEDVIISDSDPNASYPATGTNAFKNHFASIKVKVIGDFEEKVLSGYHMLKKQADTTTTINFAYASGSNNGQGLYLLAETENDTNPIYYYRGAVDNNNVVFGGFCWQIVRTTDTGGIKMIYNGLPDISGSGNNITYNCGTTRDIQDTIRTTTSLSQSTGYYYADDYEIVSTSGNSVTYRLKSKTNPITQVAISDATAAASNIPTIVTNYPYTCKQTTDSATCTTLYKVDSYASGTNANVYSSLDRTIIGRSAFNLNYDSLSDVGYMSNTRYAYKSSAPTSGAYFGRDIEYGDFDSDGTDEYRLLDDGNGSVGTTLDSSHQYSCNVTTSTGTCTTLRYYYYNSGTTYRYINLTSGDTIEDALYKMTGTGSQATKTKNSTYTLNVNNSTAKTAIDTWFRTNLTDEVNASNPNYNIYLEDTAFCNDRSYKTEGSSNTYNQSGWNRTEGSLSTNLYFGTYNRYSNSWYSTSNVPAVKNTGEVPNIACPNETDRFTVSNTNGNGALTYPVGLLTADEIILAGVGGNNSSTFTYYLYTNDRYWSLSPYNFTNYYAYEFNSNTSNLSSDGVFNNTFGLRPVVSLRLGTEFESDGNGTGTNPYVVKYN